MSAPSSPTCLFVYGTLMSAEVLQGLLHRVPSHRPALLRGYARWTVKRATFPAILRAAAADSVDGIVLDGLSARELRCLDFYEDEAYERLAVSVECMRTKERIDACTYVWPSPLERLVDVGSAWNYDEWRRLHMGSFVPSVVLPCAEEFARRDDSDEERRGQ